MFLINYFICSTDIPYEHSVYSEAELADWIETMFYSYEKALVITSILKVS